VAEFPIKLNDAYTCQGFDAKGESMVFDDLLYEGEIVGVGEVPEDYEDREARAPFGNVVRKPDGLWIVERTKAEEAHRHRRVLGEESA
jgi:hypothetical protein